MQSVRSSPTDFVFVGIQSWDLPLGGNAKDMALELAITSRVLYVNPPPDRITRFRQRDAPQPKGQPHPAGHLFRVNDALWVLYPAVTLESINWLPDSFLFDYVNRLNNQRLASRIQQAIDHLAFGPVTVFNDSDMFRSFYLKELLAPRHYVYYTRDNLMAVDYWRKHGRRLEVRLMEKADLVVSNSAYLAQLACQHNKHTEDIGQGCDLTHFNAATRYPVPNDLKSIASPRIGYVGALNASRLSIDWLVSTAQARPDWNILLIGPEDKTFQESVLHKLSNVHFLGAKSMLALPAYLQHLDVAINPQHLNALTIGNYPRKVDEYLAMGKPVVARRTETMQLFDDYVTLAETPGQFVEGIEKALRRDLPTALDSCVAFARSHTWAKSVTTLIKAINQLNSNQSITVPK